MYKIEEGKIVSVDEAKKKKWIPEIKEWRNIIKKFDEENMIQPENIKYFNVLKKKIDRGLYELASIMNR